MLPIRRVAFSDGSTLSRLDRGLSTQGFEQLVVSDTLVKTKRVESYFEDHRNEGAIEDSLVSLLAADQLRQFMKG
jgi:hypothetical protein